MKKIYIFMALACLLLLSAVPVYANGIPSLPHAFYGSVEINGNPAPVGTEVEARCEGVLTDIEDNPTVTTVSGIYGTDNPFEHRLIVQGDIEDGATITFYVNGRLATTVPATVEWHSGETSEVDLSVTIRRAAGGGFVPAPDIEANLFGIEGEFSISEDGEILETIEATSDAGDFTITIPEGTIALDEDGDPLSTLTVELDLDPPDPPTDAYIIGIPYKLGPDGATFSPPITIKYTVDPATLPPGIDVEDLVIAYYDEVAGEWVELPTTYDPATNTFTAEVEHFTTFAVIAVTPPPPPPPAPAAFTSTSLSISPLEVDIGETVSISILVANTGEEEGSYTITLKINGVVEETEEVTLAGGASETVTFTTAKDEAGTYAVDIDGLIGSFTVKEAAVPPSVVPPAVPPPGVNWAIWGPIIAVAVFLAIFLPIRLRRRRAG